MPQARRPPWGFFMDLFQRLTTMTTRQPQRPNERQQYFAFLLVLLGLLMIFLALLLPPEGEVHPSVLTAFGEILTFAGAAIGMDYHYRSKR